MKKKLNENSQILDEFVEMIDRYENDKDVVLAIKRIVDNMKSQSKDLDVEIIRLIDKRFKELL